MLKTNNAIEKNSKVDYKNVIDKQNNCNDAISRGYSKFVKDSITETEPPELTDFQDPDDLPNETKLYLTNELKTNPDFVAYLEGADFVPKFIPEKNRIVTKHLVEILNKEFSRYDVKECLDYIQICLLNINSLISNYYYGKLYEHYLNFKSKTDIKTDIPKIRR